MKLTHWKGGGFAGGQYSVRLELDVGSLPRPKAGEISALIGECGFFELPDRLPPSGSHRTDSLEYRLLVTDGGRAHQLDWDDNSVVPGTRFNGLSTRCRASRAGPTSRGSPGTPMNGECVSERLFRLRRCSTPASTRR